MMLLVKYVMPLLLFASTGTLLLTGERTFSVLGFRLLLNSPLLLAGAFFLALAEVRTSGSHLAYRRLFRWRQVPYNQIRASGKSWVPGVGFIATNTSVPPWGRIYFITLRPLFDHSQEDLLTHINERRSGKPAAQSEQHGQGDSRRASRFCLNMGLVGLLCSVVATILLPKPTSPPSWESFPQWVTLPVKVFLHLTSWPWVLIICAFLLLQILRRKFADRAWPVAFVLGYFLGAAITKAMR
jgi:hypothetical protein